LIFPKDDDNNSDGVQTSEEMGKTLQREIHMARNIQMKLLNGEKPYSTNGQFSGISIPARLIGGDYYDFYPLYNGKIRIIIGDVMGKGIPAAMLMILTRGAFRSASESTQSPGETISAMNNAIYRDLRTLSSFVTVFCADWDPHTGEFTYANAGHSLPVFLRKGVELQDVPQTKGVMLGGLPDQRYEDESILLHDHDLVFFYTDGIVEAKNRTGEMFKLARLVHVLEENLEQDASEIERIVVESITQFTQGLPQRDDITMVTLKIGKEKSEIVSINCPVLRS